jgi:hypothetical protein
LMSWTLPAYPFSLENHLAFIFRPHILCFQRFHYHKLCRN